MSRDVVKKLDGHKGNSGTGKLRNYRYTDIRNTSIVVRKIPGDSAMTIASLPLAKCVGSQTVDFSFR